MKRRPGNSSLDQQGEKCDEIGTSSSFILLRSVAALMAEDTKINVEDLNDRDLKPG